jgi:hypothetical protein
MQVQLEDHTSTMDVDEEPFDLIAGIKISGDSPPFAPVQISTGCLYDTNLPARPYAVNIILSLLSEEESQLLIKEINAIQRVSTTYQQCYNSTYTFLCSSALQIFSLSTTPDMSQTPSSLVDIAAHTLYNPIIFNTLNIARTLQSPCSSQARHALVHAALHSLMSLLDHKLLAHLILNPSSISPPSTLSAINMLLARNSSSTALRVGLFIDNEHSSTTILSQLFA